MDKNTLRVSAVVVAAAALLAGCQTQQGTNTAVGTGVGAAVGAGLGNLIGGNTTGTLVGAAVGAAAGGAAGYNWSAIKGKLTGATQGTGTQISEQPDGSLKVNIPSSVSFATNSATIAPNFRSVLDQVAQTLNQSPEVTAAVVGHTDSTGSMQLNMNLSRARAESVANYLGDHGVARQRLSAEGRGPNQPVADNGTEAGRAQNRRVEIYLRAAQAAPRG
ncbi:membrane protein [Pandoraea terrae]|uniref:Membrane protein n=1 Tax=Pandoraea terrae TaxID=1537710 RepID=A0A5E4RNT8_9BURK|nr:OmpA family protein [Pandoraea terrae]VVD63538.1 membrane protein [Pandoraea terrae]